MAARFAPHSPRDVAKLIADYPLAWVVSSDYQATPLPLLAEIAADDSIVSLLGHCARRNPQVAALQADCRAVILFQGPQGYISPRMVSKPAWGPTWNYAVARFDVTVEFVPDEIDDALERLTRHVERLHQNPWKAAQMGIRYEELRRYIIAFRAHVNHVHATFKLGQDEDDTTFADITTALGGTPLGQWMCAQRGVLAP